MIIDLTAAELNQAVTEFVCKRGIAPESKFEIKFRAGRKGNPTTAKVGINESIPVKAIQMSLPLEEDKPVPVISITEFAEATEEEATKEDALFNKAEPEQTNDSIDDEEEVAIAPTSSLFKSA